MCYYSDLTAKHMQSEATEGKFTDLSRTDVVAYKSHLLQIRDAVPVTESPMSLGTYSFPVGDHKKIYLNITLHITSHYNWM